MNTESIVVEIEAEIARLQLVKALLADDNSDGNRKLGRPAAASLSGGPAKRRTLSAEARERIAAAQRARWAKSKRSAQKAARTTAASAARKATVVAPARRAKKRTLRAGARAKIAAAQRARWAKLKKDAKMATRGGVASSATQ